MLRRGLRLGQRGKLFARHIPRSQKEQVLVLRGFGGSSEGTVDLSVAPGRAVSPAPTSRLYEPIIISRGILKNLRVDGNALPRSSAFVSVHIRLHWALGPAKQPKRTLFAFRENRGPMKGNLDFA
jgi:hypothetical protein